MTASVSITQASSVLSPLQSALQCAVSLHALCTLHQGIASDRESIQCMLSYLHEMTENESYLQILPESILSFFNSLESTLRSILHSSIQPLPSSPPTHSMPSSPPPHPSNPTPSKPPSTSITSSSSSSDPPPDPTLPIETTILVDDSLVQQHSLLQYVCSSLSSLAEHSSPKTSLSSFAICAACR